MSETMATGSNSNNSSSSELPSPSNDAAKNQQPQNQDSGLADDKHDSPKSPSGLVRRPSFGLNFLSSLTSSIRPNTQTGSSTANEPHQFMSNSPTIANLLNITSTTPLTYNENIDTVHETNDYTVTPTEGDNVQIITEQTGEEPEENHMPLESNLTGENGMDKDGLFSVRLTPLIDHSSSSSGLYFAPVIRKVKPSNSISIGRYTEKNKSAAHAPQGSSAPIVFKSKVVSRTHALFQCNEDGQWFVKDCKSSSGTFLNHIRLSPASQELTLMPLIDGDIIQLGMDYRGGTEEVYRCVKMRCEFNKSWQRKVNQFNLEIHQKLKNLAIGNKDDAAMLNPIGEALQKDELSECAICLLKLEPCQALFISPCSHSWHYKCIRPIIIKSYPQFYCPNCRSMCDLETDIDDED